MVDDEDWERVTRYKWNSVPNRNHTHYAVRGIYDPLTRKISRQWLHRFILDAPDGITVDHIDRNGLNCQRNNLRLATRSQQQINRNSWSISGFRGVSKHGNSWQAEVKIKEKDILDERKLQKKLQWLMIC